MCERATHKTFNKNFSCSTKIKKKILASEKKQYQKILYQMGLCSLFSLLSQYFPLSLSSNNGSSSSSITSDNVSWMFIPLFFHTENFCNQAYLPTFIYTFEEEKKSFCFCCLDEFYKFCHNGVREWESKNWIIDLLHKCII